MINYPKNCQLYLLFFQIIFITILIASVFLFPIISHSSEIDCGPLSIVGGYGPFDYNDPEARKEPLHLVEIAHFTPQVENLISGKSSTRVLDDLDYTLRAFPNHHRALYAFAKYDLRERQKSQQQGIPYNPPRSKAGFPATAECYFDRAIRWRPNDPVVHMIFGIFLHRSGNLGQAIKEYKISEKIQPDSADLQYNLGLLYFDRKEYALAQAHARKAYQLGYPLLGLRKKLTSVGQWP